MKLLGLVIAPSTRLGFGGSAEHQFPRWSRLPEIHEVLSEGLMAAQDVAQHVPDHRPR